MARNLYRFYLYIVSIALLDFAMYALERLIDTLLTLTPLKDSYTPAPGEAEIVQSLVFFAVSWLIAGLLGGLHYWLIRRDTRHDAAGISSPVRSFLLNITEAIVIAFAVPELGYGVIIGLGQKPFYGIIHAAATGMPLLFMFILLELERRRSPGDAEARSLFHRLHLYGVQLLLLIFLVIAWQNTFRPIIDTTLFAGQGSLGSCSGTYCTSYNPFVLALGQLWFIGFWAWYGWLLRRDASRHLRFIMHFLSFACGSGFVLYSIQTATRLVISPLFKMTVLLKDITGPGATYDFYTPFTLGVLIAIVYHLLIRTGAHRKLLDPRAVLPIEGAVAGILCAVAFWYGAGSLLYDLLQRGTASSGGPDAQTWMTAISFLVAGIGYFPLDFYLHRRSNSEPAVATSARRGFVLALLGGGLLAFAIGGATALYSWLTSIFGSPFTNWQQAVHSGLAAFVVGTILVGVYLTVFLREKLFSSFIQHTPSEAVSSTPTIETPPATLTTEATSIETVLDELLAGKITRDAAVTSLHTLIDASAAHE